MTSSTLTFETRTQQSRACEGDWRLDSIVAAFQQGHSPETMQQQYPALTLEQIYGALTYYLAHADEVNDYLRGQERLWVEWQQRCEHEQPAVLQRLRAVRQAEKTAVG